MATPTRTRAMSRSHTVATIADPNAEDTAPPQYEDIGGGGGGIGLVPHAPNAAVGEPSETAPSPNTERRGFKDRLRGFFGSRPKPAELQERNVLQAGPDVDRALHGQSRQLERSMNSDHLRQRLSTRIPRQDLVQRGIIVEAPSNTPKPSRKAADSKHHPQKSTAAVPKTPTFGITPAALATMYPNMEGGVPRFLWDCADPILKEIDSEGLFRVPGSTTEVQELKAYADEHGAIKVESVTSVHSITSLMGHFFRSLPEPLLTFDLYDDFISVARKFNQQTETTENTLCALKQLLDRLPRPNFLILRWFLELLLMVTLLSKVNKMAAENVGTVFGPTLLRPRLETINTLSLMKYHSTVVELLVRYYAELFPIDANEVPPPVLISNSRQLPPVLESAVNRQSLHMPIEKEKPQQQPPPLASVPERESMRIRSNSLGIPPSVCHEKTTDAPHVRSLTTNCNPQPRPHAPSAYGAVIRSIAAKVVEESVPEPESATENSAASVDEEQPSNDPEQQTDASESTPVDDGTATTTTSGPKKEGKSANADAESPPSPNKPSAVPKHLQSRIRASTLNSKALTPATSIGSSTPDPKHRKPPVPPKKPAHLVGVAVPQKPGGLEPRREAPKPPKFTTTPQSGAAPPQVTQATAVAINKSPRPAPPPPRPAGPPPGGNKVAPPSPGATTPSCTARPARSNITDTAPDHRRSTSLRQMNPEVIEKLRGVFKDRPPIGFAGGPDAVAAAASPQQGGFPKSGSSHSLQQPRQAVSPHMRGQSQATQKSRQLPQP